MSGDKGTALKYPLRAFGLQCVGYSGREGWLREEEEALLFFYLNSIN